MNHDRLPELSPDLKSLATDLSSLAPAAGALNRDELLYRAGWEACAALDTGARWRLVNSRDSRLGWLWPLSTAGLLLVTATLGVMFATREPAIRVVYLERPAQASASVEQPRQPIRVKEIFPPDHVAQSGAPRSSRLLHDVQARPGYEYLTLRGRVLAFGVDVLNWHSATATSDEQAAIKGSRYGALLDELRGG
jgi:hypothetical protein